MLFRSANSTKRINILDPRTLINCKVCHLAKAKKLIHREAAAKPKAPYKVVAFDFIELKKADSKGSSKYTMHFYC